jgi:GNAT superfamily N-acetyltransferase
MQQTTEALNGTVVDNHAIQVSDMKPSEAKEVIELLAVTMSSNPVNKAVFKPNHPDSVKRQKVMFRHVVHNRHNIIRVAKFGNKIVGVMCYCSSLHCQPGAIEIIKALPSILLSMKGSAFRLLKWRKIWGKHDYSFPHVHFGPFAVHKDYQGRKIGTLMLGEFCQLLDDNLSIGYLETDKRENVSFYERFGFRVIQVEDVLGVVTWFMLRLKYVTEVSF